MGHRTWLVAILAVEFFIVYGLIYSPLFLAACKWAVGCDDGSNRAEWLWTLVIGRGD